MRLAWASPFNIRSAIARFSSAVCRELAVRGVEVEIVRLESEDASDLDVLPSTFRVRAPASLSARDLRHDFDAAVVNLGDHMPFHMDAVRLLAQAPLISVFHDSDLRHFVGAIAQTGLRIDRLAEDLPATLRSPRRKDDPHAAQLSLFAALSSAAVAHGPHYVDILQAACPGPVGMLPLCYPDVGSVRPRAQPGDEFVVVTFGMINLNKQPDRVMRAIAASPDLKMRAIYRLIGAVEDTQRVRLEALAAELDLRPPEFYGWVADKRLFELLAEAHVVCCLRYPVSEGGSASLITALYSARPVVVAEVGSYSQVPGDKVWKVSYGERTDDLAAVLNEIDTDRATADERAKRAKAWAEITYSPKAYVDRFLSFLDHAIENAAVIEAGRSLGRILDSLGTAPEDPAIRRVSAHLEQLFGGPPRGIS